MEERKDVVETKAQEEMREVAGSKEGKAAIRKSAAKEWARDIIIAVVIAGVIIQFVKPTIVKESSMEPNFYANDYLFISKMAYKGDKEPARGDVVVFRSDLTTNNGKKKLLIKRVVGLPGETVTIKDGIVFIDGNELEENYTMDGFTTGEVDNLTVPEDQLFCMGDNRAVSIDSRASEVGTVEEERLVGKVVFRLFPFNKIGTIKNPFKK